MRKFFVAGNWKMNKTPSEAAELARELRNKVSSIRGVDIAVAPTAIAIAGVVKALANSNVAVSAQNLHWEAKGAFTGEISASMIQDAGCTHVIIGHSERRQFFGETDETVTKRVAAALAQGLHVILCVGETLEEREAGKTLDVVGRQLDAPLAVVESEDLANLTIAYEPVWAIGTGRTATPAQAQETHAAIRARLAGHFDTTAASSIRIQYGGSVKPGNAAELLSQPDIDGALVGGASLSAESFAAIIRAASEA